MPTPNKYKKIALRTLPYKWHFLGLSAIGVAICVLSIFISVKSQINLFPAIGVGQLIALWGWGLFLVVVWYGKQSKLASKFPKVIISINEWFSSFFLNFWFIGGSIGLFLFIWSCMKDIKFA